MKYLIITFFVILSSGISLCQEIELAPENKSVVYFVRANAYGSLINFSFFDFDKVIGRFNGLGYIRYECEPGDHDFWARSENRSFVKATLQAGKIYVIEAIPTMGGFKSAILLAPVSRDYKRLRKIQKLMSTKEAKTFRKAELAMIEDSLSNAKKRGLEKLKTLEEEGHDFIRLTPSMALEPSDLIFIKKKGRKKK